MACWVVVRAGGIVYSGRIRWLCCGRHRGGDGARTGRGNRFCRSVQDASNAVATLIEGQAWCARLGFLLLRGVLFGETGSTSGERGVGGDCVILSRREGKQGAVPQQQRAVEGVGMEESGVEDQGGGIVMWCSLRCAACAQAGTDSANPCLLSLLGWRLAAPPSPNSKKPGLFGSLDQ